MIGCEVSNVDWFELVLLKIWDLVDDYYEMLF